MKIAVIILALASLASATDISKAHDTTYKIHARTLLGGSSCSATAIGPQALLTASHCEESTDVYDLPQLDDKKFKVVKILRDGKDHSILLVKGVRFPTYAALSEKGPKQGDHVFMFGNPDDENDLYREGYAVGTVETKSYTEMMYDVNGYYGDSGAALFSVNGDVIAIVSVRRMIGDTEPKLHFMGSIPFAFTAEQLKEARAFEAKEK